MGFQSLDDGGLRMLVRIDEKRERPWELRRW